MDQTDSMPVPFGRSYWVVPGRFLAGAYPGDLDPEKAEAKLRALLEAGMRCIVDLTSEADRNVMGLALSAYSELARELAGRQGYRISYHQKSIDDLGVPSHAGMREILDIIDGSLRMDNPVYVHCLAGIGRTGTVVGCWLVRHGLALGQGAIDQIRVLRRNEPHAHISSPETERQRRFICRWEPGL